MRSCRFRSRPTPVSFQRWYTHRDLIVLPMGNHEVHINRVFRNEKANYVCTGVGTIVTLAFDAHLMYAGTSQGDVLVFDMFANQRSSCRLLHRLSRVFDTAAIQPVQVTALVQPSLVLVTTSTHVALYNVSDKNQRPSFIMRLAYDRDVEPSAPCTLPAVHVLPGLPIEDEDRAVLLIRSHARVHVLECLVSTLVGHQKRSMTS